MANSEKRPTRLRDELIKHPLASKLAVSFILMVLEKLMEPNFECPCNPTWNKLFSSAFFAIPSFLAMVLMVIIERYSSHMDYKKFIFSFGPAILWLVLLYLNGQYYACAMTDWKGRFVIVDKAAPLKWCKPFSEGNVTSPELMLRSQQFFADSQVIGISLLSISCLVLMVNLYRMGKKKDEPMQPEEGAELNEPEHKSP